jgi:cell division protein FtsL
MSEYQRRNHYIAGSTAPKEAPVTKQPRKKKSSRGERVLPRQAVQVTPFSHVLIIGSFCIAVVICSLFYVQASSTAKVLNRDISNIQSKITSYQQNNDDIKNDIAKLTELDVIREKALNDLDMVVAGESQIISYEKSESEYVRQNEDIQTK